MGKGGAGGGAFCYPSPADTAAAQLGVGMGVQFGGWETWANDASGEGAAQTKTRGLGRERRVPPFSDPRIQRPSLPISGRGGPPPPLHPPPLHPHLNCEGIWICNVGLQKGVEGLLQWPLNLEGGAKSGVTRWAEGRQAQEGCG